MCSCGAGRQTARPCVLRAPRRSFPSRVERVDHVAEVFGLLGRFHVARAELLHQLFAGETRRTQLGDVVIAVKPWERLLERAASDDCCDEDLVAPDDRRGPSPAGDLRRPLNPRRFRPALRGTRRNGDAALIVPGEIPAMFLPSMGRRRPPPLDAGRARTDRTCSFSMAASVSRAVRRRTGRGTKRSLAGLRLQIIQMGVGTAARGSGPSPARARPIRVPSAALDSARRLAVRPRRGGDSARPDRKGGDRCDRRRRARLRRVNEQRAGLKIATRAPMAPATAARRREEAQTRSWK